MFPRTQPPRDQETVSASEAEDGSDNEDTRSWATEDSQREQSHVNSGQESEAHYSSVEEITQVEDDDAAETVLLTLDGLGGGRWIPPQF